MFPATPERIQMSEFKYACPVCGQHIKCDASQAGSVMECPTCFQKITVPQAPSTAEQKFILTGSKVMERKKMAPVDAGASAAPEKKSPAVAIAIVLILLAAGAGIFFFHAPRLHHGRTAGWQTGDIGPVGADGSFSRAQGVFTLSGSGADIWYQADAFRYVFKTLDDGCTLTVHVLNLEKTDAWAKAGLMIRESLNPDSAYAMVFVSPSSGIAFQQRDHTAGPASAVRNVPNLAAPYWIRLERQGNTFQASSSEDGTTWTKMGSTTIPMGRQIYAGLAVCSHKQGTLCRAQFDYVTLHADTNAAPVAAPIAPKPVAAPPASDTNWLLHLDAAVIPDTPAAGRIHAQDFISERATFQTGTLTLRAGARGAFEFGVAINFSGAQPEALSGKSLNLLAGTNTSARVMLRWKDADGTVQKSNYDDGYALRLEFGALANNRLPGKIYLCLPDPEKSYLMGTFNADARKPKPKSPKK
jgi:regulation of enolase protein 1 (concanavalin A-like superfamily)/DNA-directed RNA polymerase subunit RPC12/RpoP